MTDTDLPAATQEYVDETRALNSSGTATARESNLRQWVAWCREQGIDVTDATPRQFRQYIIGMSETYSEATISSRMDSVRLFYEWAASHHPDTEIDENPADGIDLGEITDGRSNGVTSEKKRNLNQIYLDTEEVQAMLDSVPAPTDRNRLFIELLFQTGVRVSEAITIRLDDIDRESRAITITEEKKGDVDRTVYYTAELDDSLGRWLDEGRRDRFLSAADSPYLFVSRKSPQLSKSAAEEVVRNAAKEAGVQEEMYVDAAGQSRWKVTPHTLRHTAAVQALKNGADSVFVKKQLGHDDISTTERYLQIANEDLADEWQKRGPTLRD